VVTSCGRCGSWACAPGRNEIDAVRLGKWLGRNKGRVVNRLQLMGEKKTDSKQLLWWLEQIA
jgi:Tfp pilus assembly protein PilP